MLCAFPFFNGDSKSLLRLLEWIEELGGCKEHDCLLVADALVQWSDVINAKETAQKSFREVRVTVTSKSVSGWPKGGNSLFHRTAEYVSKEWPQPFFLCEPDAIPLTPRWLDHIAEAYAKCGKPYMGCIYDYVGNRPEFPKRLMSGIAVYPADAFKVINPIKDSPWAWDMDLSPVMVEHGAHTPLIKHFWGQMGLPPKFAEAEDLKKGVITMAHIPEGCVLWHRNKDHSLIRLLRKKMGIEERERSGSKGVITVRRTNALGDVLAATVVADKLQELGYDVHFQSISPCHVITRRCPSVAETHEINGHCDVNLDGVYENHRERRTKSFSDIFLQAAENQLAPKRITFSSRWNCNPSMVVSDEESKQVLPLFSPHPKPWVLICPRSNSHTNRTVPNHIWEQAGKQIQGTKFWMGTDNAPPGFVDLHARHMDRVIWFIHRCDLMVTVDTGPMHIGAALGKPMVVIEQASAPELHISDQRDFVVVRPGLNCLNCQDTICKINADVPPCQNVSPELIAQSANKKLAYLNPNSVSAVIPIFRPPVARLNKCVEMAMVQVDEVIVTMDAGGVVPHGAIQHPKVRYVKHRLANIGVGRNINFGARHSGGHFLLILNDDVFLNPNCVEIMKREMTSDVGLVTHLLYYPDGTIQHGGKYRNPGDTGGWGHVSHRQRHSQYTGAVEQETACLASALCRREVFYQIKGFDEEFKFYCEDDDFGMRTRQAGWRIVFTPHCSGIHEEHQSTKSIPNIHNIMRESCQLFGRKWGGYLEKNKYIIPGKF